jgi:hypothetical protein
LLFSFGVILRDLKSLQAKGKATLSSLSHLNKVPEQAMLESPWVGNTFVLILLFFDVEKYISFLTFKDFFWWCQNLNSGFYAC